MTVDDGFAGGVCRCSGCGTIQTVPAEATQMVGATSGKVIFEKPGRMGSNLDELGQIVSSSGLVGSGLVSGHRHAPPPPKNRILKPAAVGGAIALLLATGVLIGLSMRGSTGVVQPDSPSSVEGHSKSSASKTVQSKSEETRKTKSTAKSKSNDSTARGESKRASGAHSISDLDLSESKVVIFLFDRGESTRPFIDDLRKSALDVAGKLGAERKFQIIYWTANSDTPLAPEVPETPSDSTIEQTRSELANIEIPRSTDIEPALEIALEGSPTDIIIASAKGWQLDEDFVKFVVESTKPKSIRVHTIAFSTGPESEALKQIASETNGQFVVWK